MNPTQIKQQRLSEESTTESSTSVSGDSEADRQTDEDLGSVSINSSGPWTTEEEFMAYALTIPEIAGRYSDADPAFRDDVEDLDPPILKNYMPRKHDRDRPQGGGGGGRQHSNYHHGQSQGQHHGNNRGYSNHGNYYRNHNRHGGQGPQHQYHKHPRSSSREDGRGANRYNDQRGDGGYHGLKRKSDHSQSSEPNSQFYAKPIGNKYPRYQNDSEDDTKA